MEAAAAAPLVLVVDDEPGVRRLLQVALVQWGMRVAVAGDGREALLALASAEPALVILDLSMPVMDGMQALSALRQKSPELPVILMTAYGEDDRAKQAQALGAQATLTKPFDIFTLREVAQRLVAHGGDRAGELAEGSDV